MNLGFWSGVGVTAVACGIAFGFMVLVFAGHYKGKW
jgi:hypothetical protein